jgi:transcriptional regulator with XRE-family HTH domain
MPNISSNAFQKLKDVKRRRRFIANQIKNAFAFQVRALRKAREMSQQELAKEAETTQALISRIERNGATNLSVKTLQKIADAFDVALVVRLEPIDRLLHWVDNLSPEAMAFPKSAQILAEMEAAAVSSMEVSTAAGSMFRVIEGTTLDVVQRSLDFDRLRLIVTESTAESTVENTPVVIEREDTSTWQKTMIR